MHAAGWQPAVWTRLSSQIPMLSFTALSRIRYVLLRASFCGTRCSVRFSGNRSVVHISSCGGEECHFLYMQIVKRIPTDRQTHGRKTPNLVCWCCFSVGCRNASGCWGPETWRNRPIKGDDKKPCCSGRWHTSYGSSGQDGGSSGIFFCPHDFSSVVTWVLVCLGVFWRRWQLVEDRKVDGAGIFRHLPVVRNGEVVALLHITKCLYDAIACMECAANKGSAIAACCCCPGCWSVRSEWCG